MCGIVTLCTFYVHNNLLFLFAFIGYSSRKTAEITSSGGHTSCIDMRYCNNQANVDPAIAMMIIEEGGGWVPHDDEVFAAPNDGRSGKMWCQKLDIGKRV